MVDKGTTMDEKRKFFRLNNRGEMFAYFNKHPLEVINISASSLAVNTKLILPQTGVVELKINLFISQFTYELLNKKRDDGLTILLFNEQNKINNLLLVLKNIRNEQSKH